MFTIVNWLSFSLLSVSLTNTAKKGLQFKQQLVEVVRNSVEDYERIFVFSVDNMRNGKLKDLRDDWKKDSRYLIISVSKSFSIFLRKVYCPFKKKTHANSVLFFPDCCRFFFGKNKVMQLGLGKTKADEPHANLHLLSKRVVGQCGLLFTNRSTQEVIDFFESFGAPDYARSGFVATEDVVLPEGPLPDFSHALEPHLRQLGMPTSLQRGVITLLQDYQVCKKGSVLTPEQARILVSRVVGKYQNFVMKELY